MSISFSDEFSPLLVCDSSQKPLLSRPRLLNCLVPRHRDLNQVLISNTQKPQCLFERVVSCGGTQHYPWLSTDDPSRTYLVDPWPSELVIRVVARDEEGGHVPYSAPRHYVSPCVSRI